jgi:exodeoxyribonuclease V alpha subunit
MSKPLRLVVVDKKIANTQIDVTAKRQQIIDSQIEHSQKKESRAVVVTGVIKKIQKKVSPKDPTELILYCPKMDQSFNAVIPSKLFCPLRENDTIYAKCIFTDNVLHVVDQPFAQPAIDKDYIIQCFIRAAKIAFLPAKKLYETMSINAGSNDEVITYLSQLAQNWNDDRNMDILYMFDHVESETFKKLLTWWYRERNLRRLWLFGLTNKEINACRLTCDEIYQQCLTNPFTLPAISLEKCQAIHQILSKTVDINDNTRGSIIRVIWKNLHERGWTCVPNKFIFRQFPEISMHLETLKNEYNLINDVDAFYLRYPYKVECWIAKYFIAKRLEDKITYDTPLDDINRFGAHYTRELSEDQMRAVNGALDHIVSIITGAGGCGKTVVLSQITHNLELRNIPYAVCSFTGKAVARIREVTKSQKPSTIHRLIHNAKTDPFKKKKTQFEKDIPLAEYEHVIFDESSMITTELLYDFLLKYPGIKKLTFLGDCNQLQPIGWGSFFQQMLKSETIPTYRLTTNFRSITKTGVKDGIILNANEIMTHNNLEPFEFTETDNFYVKEGPIEMVYDIIKGCFNSGIKSKDLVVICPYNRYIDQINRRFQSIYDLGGRRVTDSRGYTWIVGDRVMLTENDADIGVFNGETGYIKDLTDKAVLVDFGLAGCHEFLIEPTAQNKTYNRYGQAVGYGYQDGIAESVAEDEDVIDSERTVKKLTLSFCITVDKSQGSEYAYVVGYIPEFNTGSFINKNRIYTLFSRAQTLFWFVVDSIADLNVAAIKPSPIRFDNLYKRLSEALPNLKPFKIATKLVGDNEMEGDMYDDYDDYDHYDNGYFVEC